MYIIIILYYITLTLSLHLWIMIHGCEHKIYCKCVEQP